MKKNRKQRTIKWETTEKPISVAAIEEIASSLKCIFPRRFLEIASKFNGGSPDPDLFDVGEREEYVFDHLLRFPDHFAKMRESIGESLPNGVIPFAVDPLDNAICFDYRESKVGGEPQIVFWDHEASASSAEAVFFLSESFDAFLEKKIYR